MKYVIEFDLPDNDTVLNNIKTACVGWNVWGYCGSAYAKPKQPERKTGKWIEDGYNYIKAVCSICGEPCATYIMGNPRDRFCERCGADMRGEGEQDVDVGT